MLVHLPEQRSFHVGQPKDLLDHSDFVRILCEKELDGRIALQDGTRWCIKIAGTLGQKDGTRPQLAIGPRNLFHDPCRGGMAEQRPGLIRDEILGLMQTVWCGKELGEEVHQRKEQTALEVWCVL